MKRFWWYIQKYNEDMTLSDKGLLRVCMLSLGVLLGLCMPHKSKKTVGAAAITGFLLSYVPLVGKFVSLMFPRKKRLINGQQLSEGSDILVDRVYSE